MPWKQMKTIDDVSFALFNFINQSAEQIAVGRFCESVLLRTPLLPLDFVSDSSLGSFK